MNKNISDEISKIINAFNGAKYDFVIDKTSILLKKHPKNDFLWNIKGLCLQIQKKYKLSIICLLNALQINDKNLAAINNLGICYKNTMNYAAAEKCFNKIININPTHIKALINLGNLKNETLQFEDAIQFYIKVINLNDKIPECHLNLANAYQSINKIIEAKNHLNKTLEIDSSLTRADKMLSALTDYNKNNEHLSIMLDKINNLILSDKKKIYLYFAIAKAFEDQKKYDESFEYLKKGNDLQRSITNYKFENIKKLAQSIKAFFTNHDFKTNLKEINTQKIIFIIGMPRSGTTLVEKIIASHPKVSALGELNILSNILFSNIIKNHELDFNTVDEFLGKDLTTSYMFFLKSFKFDKEYITDKSLTNFWFIGFIKNFFPNSKIIHCSREPRDNCLSIYKNLFDTHEGWYYNQKELANYYKIYEDLMLFWNNKLHRDIYNIKYEDLIANSALKMKEVINFCNLEWDDACLNFYNSKTAIKTLSVNQANKPIYSSSVNSSDNYKKKLSVLFSNLD